MLERYNDVLRVLALEEGALLIDLARRLPKDSRYFYDTIHFTNEGAERVGREIYRALCPHLAKNIPDRALQSCTEESA
jgi:hypothetical protein